MPSDHYLTFAAFLLRKGDEIKEAIACSLGDVNGQAQMRKLCFCGARIVFDSHSTTWYCERSRKTIDLSPYNLEPLENSGDARAEFETDLSNLFDPSVEAIPARGQDGRYHVYVKIPQDSLWAIADPLPVMVIVLTKPMPTAPVVVIHFDVGSGTERAFFIDLLLDVRHQLHAGLLHQLALGDAIRLHFVDAATLRAVASKPIREQVGTTYALQEALALAACFSPDQYDFRTAIADLKDAEEVETTAMLDRLGLLTCLEYKRRFLSEKPHHFWEIGEHIKGCEQCRRIFGDRYDHLPPESGTETP